MTERTEQEQKWLEEKAADMGGVSAEELRRMQRWDDLLCIELSSRSPLEGREGFRVCLEAERNLHLLATAAIQDNLFGDNVVMKMLLTDASYRAYAMTERLRDEIQEGEGR